MLHLYLDESGDHSLRHILPSYPLFVLGGVILADDGAVAAAEAAVAAFKRRWFGAARVVLHTADLVRNRGAFVGLKDMALRGWFFDDFNELLRSLEFSVVACAVRKDAHLERYGDEAIDFVSKSGASAGTELADIVVSPLGRMLLGKRTRIDQSIVQAKLRRGPDGREWGRGLIVLPHE